MNNSTRLKEVAVIIDSMDEMQNAEAVCIIHARSIPESYKHVRDVITHKYRVSIYDMKLIGKKSYMLQVHGLGMFQIL